MKRGTLILFAKMPKAGRVKTRLGERIGFARAATLFRLMTALTVKAALKAQKRVPALRLILAVDPPISLRESIPCWHGLSDHVMQSPGNLGDRMKQAMRSIPQGPVVVIGTDAPQIGSRHIIEAFHKLGDHDAVFGPALDGGYWLIGLARRKPAPRLFENVQWSSPLTLQHTVASLPQGFSVAMLETLQDVDEKSDLDSLGYEIFSYSGNQ